MQQLKKALFVVLISLTTCFNSSAQSNGFEVLKSLDTAGIHALDVGLKRPSLDDVFLSLTGHVAEEKSA